MDLDIEEIHEGKAKSALARSVMERLPRWFGIPESILEYAEGVGPHPFFAAFSGGTCIGFFSGMTHYGRTGEVYVCGVLEDFHGKGVGSSLYRALEKRFIELGCRYALVKTLSDIVNNAEYAATRGFYRSVGFEELITLTEMWSPEHPCLLMLKDLSR
jgi:ribosomal protein S18 acetylase RimI-like enzyme